jgi:hypothetical protein
MATDEAPGLMIIQVFKTEPGDLNIADLPFPDSSLPDAYQAAKKCLQGHIELAKNRGQSPSMRARLIDANGNMAGDLYPLPDGSIVINRTR